MNCSISNIAWEEKNDPKMYAFLQEKGYKALEIAPTRIFPENPYAQRGKASTWAKELENNYGLKISSIQSIWYGREEMIFGSEEERRILTDYTEKAMEFAVSIGCKNVVFGCPKQRNNPDNQSMDIFYDFLAHCGDFALSVGTVFSLEANPKLYGTNVVNTTSEAFAVVEKISSSGLSVNVDLGTMLLEEEPVSLLKSHKNHINHVHISEKNLALIEKRESHQELKNILAEINYENYVSIEMKQAESLSLVEKTIEYIGDIYG